MHAISEATSWLGATPKALWHWEPACDGTYRIYSDADLGRWARSHRFSTPPPMPPRASPQGELLRRHRASISEWYEVTASRQLILARMYVADERFGAVYGGQQDYLLELVEAQAAAEGLDVKNPAW